MTLALFRAFPGTASLPRVDLAALPTPAVRVDERLARGVKALWIKRDDVTAAAYGGNKVRKLEFTLGAALDQESRSIVTFGALGSNHVLATGVHARPLGIEVHAVLTPQYPTSYLPANLASDVAEGVSLHPVGSFDDAPREAAALRARLRKRDGVEPLVIPFGGTTPEAEAGFVSAGLELAEQVAAGVLLEPDVVYLPLGSAGTAVGLALGLSVAGMRTRVVAVRVVPADFADEARVAELVQDTVVLLRDLDAAFPSVAVEDLKLDVRHEFFGDGYAAPTQEGRDAVAEAARAGMRLETTYTGKALAALRADAKAGQLDGKNVLFWNTYNSQTLPATADAVPASLASYVLAGPDGGMQ